MHGGPLHAHTPLAPHAVPLSHTAQAAPSVPQDLLDCDGYGSQVPFAAQHPAGHDFALQVHWPLSSHSCPDAHSMQFAPAAPHAQ